MAVHGPRYGPYSSTVRVDGREERRENTKILLKYDVLSSEFHQVKHSKEEY